MAKLLLTRNPNPQPGDTIVVSEEYDGDVFYSWDGVVTDTVHKRNEDTGILATVPASTMVIRVGAPRTEEDVYAARQLQWGEAAWRDEDFRRNPAALLSQQAASPVYNQRLALYTALPDLANFTGVNDILTDEDVLGLLILLSLAAQYGLV